MRRIMHLDLDVFFVAVERLRQPELNGQPVIVGGRVEHRGVVSTASYEARAFGVHSGMPMAAARRLCPDAAFVDSNFGDYLDYSRKFMKILAGFSPFLEPAGLDEAYLDATGFESLHGSAAAMAAAIRARVKRELGLAVSVGIAAGKLVAKIASDAAKPDGVLEIAPGGEREFLAPLAIERLPGIGRKTAPQLRKLGIATLGQLAGMPAATLKQYFGSAGEVMQRHARGVDQSRVLPPGEAKSVSRETTFHRDVASPDILRATLAYLAEHVARKLRQHHRQAATVAVKLRYADFTTVTRQVSLPQPGNSDRLIGDTALKLLAKERAKSGSPLRLIGVRAARLAESGAQLNLLADAPESEQRLEGALDAIRDRYGGDAILSGRTLAAASRKRKRRPENQT